jgi:hypothetical protein
MSALLDAAQVRAELQEDQAERGLVLLREALACFKCSDNRQTAERVRLAISSAKGAVRICGYRTVQEYRTDRLAAGEDVR